MTDWWSVSPARSGQDGERQEWKAQVDRDAERIARSGEDLSGQPDDWRREPDGQFVDTREPAEPETGEAQKPDRRKGLLLGAAGAAVAGIVVFAAMPHGGSPSPTGSSASSAAQPGGFLPAAGGGPSGDPQDRAEASTSPVKPKPKTVVLTASPDGSGQVGAVMKVTITNNTDETVVVMSSMVKGDGRPAVIGEGTLAPGSRRIEPGETASGTIEFASKKAPDQVALMDLSGNVVAASG
jgi:hypothetical protein